MDMNVNLNRQQVEIDGERDAQSDTSKLLWFVVGLALKHRWDSHCLHLSTDTTRNAHF